MGETIHVVPINDLIEHVTNGTGCPCGPSVELIGGGDGGDGWLISHYSLDGRELDEEDDEDDSGSS